MINEKSCSALRITGSASAFALEATHIRHIKVTSPDRLSNMLLMASENILMLFDESPT